MKRFDLVCKNLTANEEQFKEIESTLKKSLGNLGNDNAPIMLEIENVVTIEDKQFTEDEKEVARVFLKNGFKFAANSDTGETWFYKYCPRKGQLSWFDSTMVRSPRRFECLRFSDPEPVEIERYI
jgi:hypothetical protein